MPDIPVLKLKCVLHNFESGTWTEAWYHQEQEHPLGLLAIWRLAEAE